MTTSVMASGYATPMIFDNGPRPYRHSTTPHHRAQPTCRLGMAANWLVSPPRPRGALASPPHQPYAEYCSMVSRKPYTSSRRRGGQVGRRVKPTRPMSVEVISQVLTRR